MTRLLVTGASGHLGRRVLHHLVDTLGVSPERIIATTRDPGGLADVAAGGIEVRAADFDDPASLPDIFSDADRLLLISTDAIDRPGRRLAQHEAALEAAVKAGVKHLVYTSCPAPETTPFLLAPDHAATEAAIARSPLAAWTVLRNNWYFENLFMSLPPVLGSGKWYSASGDGRIAHIARDDLGRAAAAALAGTGGGKTTLTLGGAKAYTIAEIAALVAAAVGKPIEVVPVTIEDLVRGMVAHGLPEPVARAFASIDASNAAGFGAEVNDAYRTLTGVDPLPFETWLEANRAALAALAP